MKRIKVYIFIASFLFVVTSIALLPHFAPVLAQDCSNTTCPQTLLEGFGLLQNIINAMVAISVIVYFIMIVTSGIFFMTASGDPKKIDNAKKTILFSTVGFALIFLPFFVIPWLGSITKLTNGISIGTTNGISFNLKSTFTQTPLPTYDINTATPTTIAGGGSGGTMSLAGCKINLVNGTPIFYQYIPTNPGTYTIDSGYTKPCELYGEYDSYAQAKLLEGYVCNPSSLVTVVDTYLNRLGYVGSLRIIDGVNALEEVGGLSAPGSGYIWSQGAPYYRFGHDVTAANILAKNSSNGNLTFQASAIAGSGAIPGGNDNDFNRVVKAANDGYPVITGMDNHYFTVLSYDGNNLTVADTGRNTAFWWGVTCLRHYCPEAYHTDGTQYLTKAQFMSKWSGGALLLTPKGTNETL